MPTLQEAKEFLHKYVQDEYQRHHAEMVSIAMKTLARHFGEDEEKFEITGLIHDWDFDKWPDEHPGRYEQLKKELGVDEEIIDAIKGHGKIDYNRSTILAKSLMACDELSGLLFAYMKMTQSYSAMKIKSIKKKIYKELRFAARINRQDVIKGIEEIRDLGLEEDKFLTLMRDVFVKEYDSI